MGQVCGWTEKTQIKSLETVGVVRDNAVTGEVEFHLETVGLRERGDSVGN